ncbi:histidine kinase [Marinithermus hydrothermalis DSM 14884]|uniref:Oxygen sensor histidine kinase NreB n=1 Tax=Marinithermus hydrothermalis (strain DSM 14884 / JCM 11576 / T1) TaxID=869210 RepID=F2NQ08_MARHT|nr:histidine kinase [Marinithermus hydrothermalis DSM 14884]
MCRVAEGEHARPWPRTEAEQRTRELETLQRLAQATLRSLEPREVLQSALATLVHTGWFRCGEAFITGTAGLDTVAVGTCPYTDLKACALRPALLEWVREALEAKEVRQVQGWQIVPIDAEAAIAVSGGQVSRPFLNTVVECIRAAFERARLYTALKEKEAQRARLFKALLNAQEEERTRISRDLHDQVGQALTGIILGLEAALADPNPARLEGLKELAGMTLADVRRIALDLRPSVLDELGLEAALKRYTREVGERYGLEVELVARLPLRLPPEMETVLYRVAQEALTNVVRHARAQRVSVVLTAHRDAVQLVVEDDGVGFDPRRVASTRLGLAGMRERVELLGGQFRLESAPGAGTTVYARLPLKPGGRA